MPLTDEEKKELAELRKLDDGPEEPSWKEKAGAVAYGAATGLAGGLGELEEFGAYTVPEFLGLREKDQRDTLGGRQTIFPTVKEAQAGLQKVGIQPPREEVSGYQTAGEILGGFGTSIPGMARKGAQTLLGTTSKIGESSAKMAEKLGFKLSPTQVRQAGPSAERGAIGFAKENQELANKLASKGTGKEAKFVDEKFISERLSTLGKEYDKLYKGKEFAIDSSVVNALNNILVKEQELGVAGVSTVKQAAQTMLDTIQRQGLKVSGDDLQRLRNALTERARGTSSRGNAHEIYELVDVIDDSVGNLNKGFKKTLDELRPKYRNSIILEDLYRSGGIQRGDISLDRLGKMLTSERSAVRRAAQDIDDLAKIGRDNKIKAIWEVEGKVPSEGTAALKQGLGTDLMRFIETPLRTRAARSAQRFYGNRPEPTRIPGAAATAAGTLVRPLQTEE